MIAKLTIYSDNSGQESGAGSIPLSPQATPSNDLRNWQLVADNLTTGKLTELLLCLDELGFLSVETDGLPME